MFRVRFDESLIDGSFFYHYGQSDTYKKQAINKATKGNQTSINQGNLKSILIPLPEYKIQERISLFISSLEEKVYTEKIRKDALESLFNSLLHHLMTGKVRVMND